MWLHAVVVRKSGTNLLSREGWEGRAIIIVSRRARFESGLSQSGRLSGLPLVHRVYFIMHAGESHAKPLMFSKTLSTMDDGRKSRGWAARERGSERKRRRYRNECCEWHAALCLLTSLFFYHLELGKIFFAFELAPRSYVALLSSASSSSSVFFPSGTPSNFVPSLWSV